MNCELCKKTLERNLLGQRNNQLGWKIVDAWYDQITVHYICADELYKKNIDPCFVKIYNKIKNIIIITVILCLKRYNIPKCIMRHIFDNFNIFENPKSRVLKSSSIKSYKPHTRCVFVNVEDCFIDNHNISKKNYKLYKIYDSDNEDYILYLMKFLINKKRDLDNEIVIPDFENKNLMIRLFAIYENQLPKKSKKRKLDF